MEGHCTAEQRTRLSGEEALQERGRHVPLLEVWVVKDAFVEWDGGLDAFDDKFVERPAHAGDGFLPVAPMGDDFGDHGIVMRYDQGIGFHGGIYSDPETAWGAVFRDQTR